MYTWAQLYSRSPLRKKTFRLDYGLSLLAYIRFTLLTYNAVFVTREYDLDREMRVSV